MKPLLFIFIVIFGASHLNAQKLLALDKPGKVNRIRYYKGDLIHLMTLKGEQHYGEITTIKDSSFVVGAQEIKLSAVKYIQNTQKHEGWELLSQLSLTAALGYFLIDSGNHLINGEAEKVAHSEVLVSSSIMMGVFLISNRIANRKYRLNKNRSLKIIDLNIE